jgi:2-oxoglutarate ferredoxin oxidoreductase subunit beta
MPIKMAELLSALETPGYIVREALIKPKYIHRAKKAIHKAFSYQMTHTCFSLVELLSTCPTNWGVTPVEALKWVEEKMLPYYPLGEHKTPEAGRLNPAAGRKHAE